MEICYRSSEMEEELTIEVNYTPGEREERWSYYGATPGCGPDVDIVSVTVPLVVEGPERNPYKKGRVVYMIPWDGELSSFDSDIQGIIDTCEKYIQDAQDDARISAYEDRMNDGYY